MTFQTSRAALGLRRRTTRSPPASSAATSPPAVRYQASETSPRRCTSPDRRSGRPLKRLATSGLVHIRQGDTTTVRDIRRDGGSTCSTLVNDDGLDISVARSAVEARAAIAPIVAGLAATRMSAAGFDQLHAAVDEITAETDPLALQVLALEFWDRIVDGAESIVYRLMFNTLRAAYEPALPAPGGDGWGGRAGRWLEPSSRLSKTATPPAPDRPPTTCFPSTTALLAVFDAAAHPTEDPMTTDHAPASHSPTGRRTACSGHRRITTLRAATAEFCTTRPLDDRRTSRRITGRTDALGDWQWTDALVVAILLAVSPVIEWLIHVGILHWRPPHGRWREDRLILARDHRRHHHTPRHPTHLHSPWPVLVGLLPALTLIGVFAFSRVSLGMTFLLTVTAFSCSTSGHTPHPHRLQAAPPALPRGLQEPPLPPLPRTSTTGTRSRRRAPQTDCWHPTRTRRRSPRRRRRRTCTAHRRKAPAQDCGDPATAMVATPAVPRAATSTSRRAAKSFWSAGTMLRAKVAEVMGVAIDEDVADDRRAVAVLADRLRVVQKRHIGELWRS